MIISMHSYSRERPGGKVYIPADTQHANPITIKKFFRSWAPLKSGARIILPYYSWFDLKITT